MNQTLTRWLTVSVLAISTVAPLAELRADDTGSAGGGGETVEQLKAQAFHALRQGQFDTGNQLLEQAVRAANDPALARMAQWTQQFDAQLHVFSSQRHDAYEKAVADVKLLLDKGHEDYALDLASRALLLCDDKDKFNNEPWVKSIEDDSIKHGTEYQQKSDWLKAMRVYADLQALQPASREWKEDLKDMNRRVRLLVLYAPGALKSMQSKETQERDTVDALLFPATQPTTQPLAGAATAPTTQPLAATGTGTNGPATQPLGSADVTDVTDDSFRLDWRETLRDVQMPMLQSAVHDAYTNYYRDITYRQMMVDGLAGLRAVVTTDGLQQAFPGLADPARREAFARCLDQWTAAVNNADPADQQSQIDELLGTDHDALLAVNNATIQLPEPVLVSEFAAGALTNLDMFSNMIWPSDLDDFNKTTQGEFSGVGISIKPNPQGYIEVVSPLEDTPAYRAGIKAGDWIVGINGKSTKGISSDTAVKTITGPTGTTVRLTLRDPSTSHDTQYTIRRETIKVVSVKGYEHKPGGGWDYFVDPDNRIAYVRITNFTKGSGEELERAISDMGDNVNGLILDLRDNPGGLLTAAIDVSDKFLNSGVIVSTRADRETPNQPTIATARDDGDQFKKPLVVLVNQYSASASEIVSGALHDDHRAILVGERTYGKGSVQMLFPLDSRKAFLKLTCSHYYLPSGRCIHREENSTTWGVDPDVTVNMTPEQMQKVQIARENMDVLRAVNAAPAAGADQKLQQSITPIEAAKTAAASTQPTPQGLLNVDPQLAAAVLMLRLQAAGAAL